MAKSTENVRIASTNEAREREKIMGKSARERDKKEQEQKYSERKSPKINDTHVSKECGFHNEAQHTSIEICGKCSEKCYF